MPITLVSQPIISAGEFLSSVLDVSANNAGIRRITFPAGWTSAWLTFQFSSDNASFSDMYWPNGQLVVVTVVPGGTIMLSTDVWQAGYFKFRSGSPLDPIAQDEERVFQCALD